MNAPKLCSECKWVAEPGRFSKCKAPQNMRAVAPTGFEQISNTRIEYCEIMRSDNYIDSIVMRTCGKRGRWWVAK